MSSLAPEQDPKIWNAIAPKYAKHVHPLTAAFAPDAVRLATLSTGDRVLDVACGAGAISVPAAKTGAEVLAVDLAPTFVDLVTARAKEEGLANLSARVMDGQAMDLPDDSFDAALSNFGVFLFPEREKGFREIHRVLKPGGRAVLTSFMAPPENQWMAFFGESVHRAFPDMPPAAPPKFLELADADRFRDELLDAGFADVEIQTMTHALTWSSVDAAWVALAEGAPVFRPMMERVGSEGVAKLRASFDALAAERFGATGAITLSAPAHYAVARKQ